MSKRNYAAPLALILASASLTGGAQAAALGRLITYSHLNEPLSALVEIEDVDAESVKSASVSARIAPQGVYDAAGLRRPSWADSARVSANLIDAGRVAVRVTTPMPITDPASALIIEIVVGAERVSKEYALILDPAESKEARKANPSKLSEREFARQSEQPAQMPAPIATRPARPAPSPSAAPAPATESGVRVNSGDTLGSIVAANKPSTVSSDQMMVAIAKGNPDAFIGGNINRLKSGSILRMPSQEQAMELSREQAKSEVARQMGEWSQWRKSATASAATPMPTTTATEGSGKVEKAPAPKAATQDRLSIDQAAGASSSDKIARAKELQESKDRVRELERVQEDMKKLLELKNAQIAKMGEELETAKKNASAAAKPGPIEKRPATPLPPLPERPGMKPPIKDGEPVMPPAPAASEPAAAASAPLPMPAASASLPAPAPASTMVSDPATPAPSAEEPKPAASAASAPAKKPVAKRPAPPPPPPEPEGLAGFVKSNPAAVYGLGGALALLLGFLGWRSQKNKRARLSRDTRGPETIGPGTGPTMMDETREPEGLALTPFDEHLQASDTYLAFGQHEKSLEEAKSALSIKPNEPEALARALRACAKLRDRVKFDQYAQLLEPQKESSAQLWREAKELEAEAFGGAAALGASSLEDLLADDGQAQAAVARIEASERALEESHQMNFEAPLPPPRAHSIELDSAPAAPHAYVAPEPASTESFDLALPDDLPESPSGLEFHTGSATREESQELAPLSLDLPPQAINLESESAAAAPAPAPIALDAEMENAEMRTMLDLAKAYNEMGDTDGARELLTEIAAGDTGAVGKEAKALLDSMK